MNTLRVLIIEDFENDALLAARALSKAGYSVRHERIESADALREALTRERWDAIISDFSVPGFGALPALDIVRESGKRIPVFVVSSRAAEESVVAVIKAGARDYLRKDHLSQLGERVRQEIEADRNADGGRPELRESLQNVITEADKLLGSDLSGSVLHEHARRLRDLSAKALTALGES